MTQFSYDSFISHMLLLFGDTIVYPPYFQEVFF